MAEAIVSIVVGRISDLLIEEPQLLHGVRDEIEELVSKLRKMKTFLPDADSRISEDRICILLAHVRELAYDAEHAVESFFILWKTNSVDEHKEVFKNDQRYSKQAVSLLHSISTLESSNSSYGAAGKLKRFHSYTTVEPEIFVGFHGDFDFLVGHLVDESDDRYSLISICGMGGLGKTTLAQKIYNDSKIKNYFAGLAWVSISQKWHVKQVLQRILICLIHEKKEEILKMDDDKLVENLQQIQQKKKCLIVLDDIWSMDAWDSIKVAFTAEHSVSKLMLTSRNVEVAKHVNPKGLIHRPGSLSADQSWELLRLKALPTRGECFFEAIYLREGNDFHLSLFAPTRQLVIYQDENHRSKMNNSYIVKRPNHQHYRSMLYRNVIWTSLAPALKLHFANFRSLRVLALEGVYFYRRTLIGTLFGTDLERVIGSLVYLRYLSARDSDLIIFPWIEKLVLLQTLKVGQLFLMKPSNILGKLAHLRYLYLPSSFIHKSGKNFKLQFDGLSKLETLKNFDTRWCDIKDLPKLSSLRILKLRAEGGYEDVEEMIKYLSSLALSSTSSLRYLALDIKIHRERGKYPTDIMRQLFLDLKFILRELTIDGELQELAQSFEEKQLNSTHIDVSLMCITTLYLRGSWLSEDPMPVLEKIPTLRVLQLSSVIFQSWRSVPKDSYVGKKMVCSSMGFPKLISLELSGSPTLVEWRVEKGSMPILIKLSISHLSKLEELPKGLVYLRSLRRFHLTMPSVFLDKIGVKGKPGPEFYKVAHIPSLMIVPYSI